jgi:ABC-type phosphate/phosphonate transport system permease subunit
MITCVTPLIVGNFNDAYSFQVEHKQEGRFENKVNTTNLSGIEYLIASIYNNNRLMYAIIVTVVMAILGTIMSYLTDLVLKALGLEVSRISHRE